MRRKYIIVFLTVICILIPLISHINVEEYGIYYNREVTAVLKIVSEGTSSENGIYYLCRPLCIDGRDDNYKRNIRLKLNNTNIKYEYGDILNADIYIYEPESSKNPGNFDYKKYLLAMNTTACATGKSETVYIGRDPDYFLKSIGYSVKGYLENILNELLENEGNITKALLLGNKNELTENTKNIFSKSGISHLMSISGAHAAFFIMPFEFILKKLKLKKQRRYIAEICILVFYMSVTGFGVPVIRAVFMMSFKRMAFILGRDNDRLIALLFSILLISLFNPFMIFSIGTQLSYGAVLSIEYINPVVAKKLKNIRILSCIKDSIKESASVCIAVQLGVLPIIINNFEMPSLFIIAANIICAPIAEFIITTGTAMIFFKLAGAAFLAEFLAFIELIAEKLILISSGYIASLTEMGSININFMPPSAIVFYYTGILLLIFFHKKRLKFHGVTVFIITVSLIFSYFFRENYGKLEVIMLDMGQGECIYLKLPLGETCLIDCGSESTDKAAEYKINPFLKRKNVRSIKYLFITHADKDHFSGLEGILKEYVIENIVLPNINFKTENYNLIEYTAKKYNSKIIYMGKNDFIKIGDVMIECLHPYKEYDIKDTNSASIVLYVKYKEFSILFTGDLDIKGEKEINDLSLKADILKIAHHGSKTSTGKDFLENVDPKAALISCGENNKYGHPSQDVIHRLENIGSSIYITYESGAITIITDGKEKNIKKFLK